MFELDCPLTNELLDIVCQVYFRLVTFFFWFVNKFIPKQTVPPIKNSLLLKSVTQLRGFLKTRKVKPSEIVEAYIARIEEVNPIINAIAFKNYEQARQQARKADERLAVLSDVGLFELYESKPLFGLPFTLKDSIMAKGFPCSSGILSMKEAHPSMPENNSSVRGLLSAGAILLASTTVAEMCLWTETNTVAFGRTNNPYDTRRIAGGSSGGEGALQGAGASLMGLGGDIAGSIRNPSFMNGIFGLLPSQYLCPGDHHIPATPPGSYKEKMLRVGPMTRFAEDLPIITKAMTSEKLCSQDETKIPRKIRIFYAEGITHNKRVEPYSKDTLDVMRKAVRHFEDKRGVVAQCIALPETDELLRMCGASIFEEGEPNLSTLLTPPIQPALEIYKSIKGESKFSFPLMPMSLAPWFNGFTSEDYKRLQEKRERFKRRINELLGDDGVLLWPGWPTLPQYHWETVAKQTSWAHTCLFSILLLPAVQCAMGLTKGVPNGVTIASKQGNEKLLLSMAQNLSDAFGGWTSPGGVQKKENYV